MECTGTKSGKATSVVAFAPTGVELAHCSPASGCNSRRKAVAKELDQASGKLVAGPARKEAQEELKKDLDAAGKTVALKLLQKTIGRLRSGNGSGVDYFRAKELSKMIFGLVLVLSLGCVEAQVDPYRVVLMREAAKLYYPMPRGWSAPPFTFRNESWTNQTAENQTEFAHQKIVDEEAMISDSTGWRSLIVKYLYKFITQMTYLISFLMFGFWNLLHASIAICLHSMLSHFGLLAYEVQLLSFIGLFFTLLRAISLVHWICMCVYSHVTFTWESLVVTWYVFISLPNLIWDWILRESGFRKGFKIMHQDDLLYTYHEEDGEAKFYAGGKLMGVAMKVNGKAAKEMAQPGSIPYRVDSAKTLKGMVHLFTKTEKGYAFVGTGFRVDHQFTFGKKSLLVTAKHVAEASTHFALASSVNREETMRVQPLKGLSLFESREFDSNGMDFTAFIIPGDRIWAFASPLGTAPPCPLAHADGDKLCLQEGDSVSVYGWRNPISNDTGHYCSLGTPGADAPFGKIKHTASTRAGWSGAPICACAGGKEFVVGVHLGTDGIQNEFVMLEVILSEIEHMMKERGLERQTYAGRRKRNTRYDEPEEDDRDQDDEFTRKGNNKKAKLGGWVSYQDWDEVDVGRGKRNKKGIDDFDDGDRPVRDKKISKFRGPERSEEIPIEAVQTIVVEPIQAVKVVEPSAPTVQTVVSEMPAAGKTPDSSMPLNASLQTSPPLESQSVASLPSVPRDTARTIGPSLDILLTLAEEFRKKRTTSSQTLTGVETASLAAAPLPSLENRQTSKSSLKSSSQKSSKKVSLSPLEISEECSDLLTNTIRTNQSTVTTEKPSTKPSTSQPKGNRSGVAPTQEMMKTLTELLTKLLETRTTPEPSTEIQVQATHTTLDTRTTELLSKSREQPEESSEGWCTVATKSGKKQRTKRSKSASETQSNGSSKA